jgi:AraC-like DNA-binding protein
MFNQTSILRHHIYLAVSFGANFQELCARMKLSPAQLSNGEGQLPWEPGEETDFWTHALELTGNPALGLHMGQAPGDNNSFGMLGMLAEHCRTVRQAIEMICQYNATLTSVFKFSLVVSGQQATFHFNPHPLWEKTNPESARQAVDLWISSLIKKLNTLTGKHIYPLRTELRFPKKYPEEYHRILKSAVYFDKPSNCMIFSSQDLDTTLISYDESLLPVFNALLKKKQEQLEANHTLKGQIKFLIFSVFQGQIVHIDVIASHLNMTTRTLQRKLSEDKTSYREISAEIRKEIAQGYLKAGKLKKNEVASLLGYSDLSSFTKAFKKSTSARQEK